MISKEPFFLLSWYKRNKKSSLNIFIPKIIGRISLSWPQSLLLRTRLGGHSLLPALKSLPWFFSIKIKGRLSICHHDEREITTDDPNWSDLDNAIFYLKAIFSFALMQKKQKIKPPYFYTKNHRTNFPIATPAARVSHSARGSLPAA